MSKIAAFFRKEPTLCIAGLAAALSCAAVPPSRAYLTYLDFKTLALLYCLMVVVAGFRGAGVFPRLAGALCARAGSTRQLCLVLVLLCFFSAMLITNDVALLTFVPFTLVVLEAGGETGLGIDVIIWETAAANLGSMLTPVGNPQNLYLYSYYNMESGDFFAATLPVCLFSLAALAGGCCLLPRRAFRPLQAQAAPVDKRRALVCGGLFLLCLLTVFRLLAWYVLLPVFCACVFIFDRRLLRQADFLLLLTFVFFFLFVGNAGQMDAVHAMLAPVLQDNELIVGALASQVISNVPAAVLLSGFTENARALLLGVDIGGLGTPVASLASLISLKLYAGAPGARTGAYLRRFSLINFSLLAVLLVLTTLFLL